MAVWDYTPGGGVAVWAHFVDGDFWVDQVFQEVFAIRGVSFCVEESVGGSFFFVQGVLALFLELL